MNNKVDEKIDQLRKDLAIIEEEVVTGYTLADAMREGCTVTEQARNWGNGDNACALSAAYIAAKARGLAK